MGPNLNSYAKIIRQNHEARTAQARLVKEAKAGQSSVNIVETVAQFVQGFVNKPAEPIKDNKASQEMPKLTFGLK